MSPSDGTTAIRAAESRTANGSTRATSTVWPTLFVDGVFRSPRGDEPRRCRRGAQPCTTRSSSTTTGRPRTRHVLGTVIVDVDDDAGTAAHAAPSPSSRRSRRHPCSPCSAAVTTTASNCRRRVAVRRAIRVSPISRATSGAHMRPRGDGAARWSPMIGSRRYARRRGPVGAPRRLRSRAAVSGRKSTLCRAVRGRARRRRVDRRRVSTDGFLYPYTELAARGLCCARASPTRTTSGALQSFVAAHADGDAGLSAPGLLARDVRHRPRAVVSTSLWSTSSCSKA